MRRLGAALWLLAVCAAACVQSDGTVASQSATAKGEVGHACPTTVADPPTVPASTSLSGDRLVPTDVPRAMLLCRYADDSPTPYPAAPGHVVTYELSGSRDVDGLAAAAADLQIPPKVPGEGQACTLIGGASFPFLVQLTYDDRVVWLATKTDVNSCAQVTNGTTTSLTYIGGDLQASYDAGTWTREVRLGGRTSCAGSFGRYGQQAHLLPEGAVRIRVCTNSTELSPVTDPHKVAELTDLVDGRPTKASEGSCEGQVTHSRELVAEYASGRSVLVHVLGGCHPDVFTSSLSTQLSDDDLQRLFALIGS